MGDSYIQTEWMPYFGEIVHSGGVNPDIDNWGILLWVQITRIKSDLVHPVNT